MEEEVEEEEEEGVTIGTDDGTIEIIVLEGIETGVEEEEGH